MARTKKTEDLIRDTFWDKLRDQIVGALDRRSCLNYSYCEDVADDVVNDISEDILDDVLAEGEDETDPLPLLETIRSRYFNVLDPVEQRELEHLLLMLRS